MPPYQLHVAISLAAVSLVSAAVALAGRSTQKAEIALPTLAGDQEPLEHDPFDVTKPEDVIDGTPIDEDRFWKRMRLRKLAMVVLLGAVLIIQAVSLGWSAVEDDRTSIAVYALHVAYALYTLALAARAITQTGAAHGKVVIHLSVLTFLATALLCLTGILPSTPINIEATVLEPSLVPRALWYSVLALYFASMLIAVTTPRGPPLHYPSEQIYSDKTLMQLTSKYEDNVCGITGASVWDYLLFSYTTKVVMLGNTAESLEIADLPIVPGNMRATTMFAVMRVALRKYRLRVFAWKPQPGSGAELAYRLLRVNGTVILIVVIIAATVAILFYVPAFFLQQVVRYLEMDPNREHMEWGFVWCAGLFFSHAVCQLLTGQLWSLSTTTMQCRIKTQLNSILFAKTLVRKDVASSAGPAPGTEDKDKKDKDKKKKEDGEKDEDEDNFSSKSQIMTLMTTDVDRVSDFSWHLFTIIDSPVELLIGTLFLYRLLGVSCFIGLAVSCIFLPLNHFASKVVVGAQDNLMKARDERVSLMNEVLGAIRMLKFMAWERSFETRVLKIRSRELKYQKINYMIEVAWNAIWNGSPILVTLVSFWHFAVVRQQVLTPSIAFTSISVFNELKFALNALPETLINILQSAVSLRRIEKYLNGAEVSSVPPLSTEPTPITVQSATISWPQERQRRRSQPPSVAPTPTRPKFILMHLNLQFPQNELSLVCGKLGSGKTLLLLALLGEADVLVGQVTCPRSPPDIIASFAGVVVPQSEWIVPGVCAYVPQSAWLRNASIRDNILFDLPYVEERYRKTLEVCALLSDLDILEDGDMSEIGERGVNLSGGQKARVSLARAVYSRASVLLLDDVLSAVDAHTAHHLYHECLRGDLMIGRTVILVSHHVQLCAPAAKYIVALDNGRLLYQGDYDKFSSSGVMDTLVQSGATDATDVNPDAAAAQHPIEEIAGEKPVALGLEPTESYSDASSTTVAAPADKKADKKAPRKLVEEEKRAVGRIGKDVWVTYVEACGGWPFWAALGTVLGLAALSPVFENGWLRIWSGSYLDDHKTARSPSYYIAIYAIINFVGLIITTFRWFVLYSGGLHASDVLYKRLLEGVLFANLRFHDTISRGRLLNRFGKDFEGIDSSLPDNFGRSIVNGLSALTTFFTISFVGGPPFILMAILLGFMYYNVAKVYGQTSRDMRRLDSVTRSPLYSIYGETISGVTVLRAFGASSKFLRDMLRCADTNTNPYYWMWGVNRWLSARFNLLSGLAISVTALVSILTPGIDASMAGFALAFASNLLGDLLFLVRRFVGLEQSMVAVERVKEFSELPREPPEFVEPRPPASWPASGAIRCENLVIRYAPDLPDVLHNLTFEVSPGEKIGVLGRTGSGKSTLALSFFRFVEPTQGRIVIDGLEISKMGLADLRSKLTIIPQDPTIMSGTLRTTLDVFNEYEDADIYEALRRVHLIPSGEATEDVEGENANVFRNLDSPVSEGGENFSTGEKQLLCMARAILKRSKVLLMDEATASVDYATDELIGKTIRHEFADSTILTIAHRLRTVIDYDRIMLLDQGRIAEYDKPAKLLADPTSKFHALCKATGKNEFATLKKMAGVQ